MAAALRRTIRHGCLAPFGRAISGLVAARRKVRQEYAVGARLDRGARTAHEVGVMVQVVQRVETHREDLAGDVKMPEVSAREAAADRTGAGLIHRAGVVGELAPLDLQATGRGEQVAVPGVPRRQDAVEQVTPER